MSSLSSSFPPSSSSAAAAAAAAVGGGAAAVGGAAAAVGGAAAGAGAGADGKVEDDVVENDGKAAITLLALPGTVLRCTHPCGLWNAMQCDDVIVWGSIVQC